MASQAEIDLIVNATNTLTQLDADLRRIVALAEARAPAIELDVDVDRGALSRITSAASTAAKSLLPLAQAGLAVGAAAPLIAGVATALQQIGPAAAVGVSAMLTLKLAAGTVQLAMIGVQESIETAFDPEATTEEFNESLKRLAPEAQKFVKVLRDMRGPLKDIQQEVQNRVFRDFDEALKALSTSTLPVLQGALNRTATSINAMGLDAAKAAIQLSNSGALGQALQSSTNALESLERVPGQVITSLGLLAAAAGPSLERIATAAASVADRVSASLIASFESGGLEQAIDSAVDAIAQLGRVAGNIFGGLGNIISGVTADGKGLFDVLEQISQGFEDITATEEFQDALRELSAVAGELARQVLPLLGTALRIIGSVVTIIGPPIRELLQVLGPVFQEILDSLREPLEAAGRLLGELAEPVGILLEVLGQLIADTLPVLTPLFDAFSQIVQELTPFIREFAENLATQLQPILAELPAILEELLPLFVELAVQVLPLLTEILKELGPELGALAVAFAEAAVEAAPIIAAFLEMAIAIGEQTLPVLTFLVEFISTAVIGILRAFTFVLNEIVVPALRFVKSVLEGDFKGALDVVLASVQNTTGLSSDSFNRMKDALVSAARDAAANVVRFFLQLADGVVSAIARMVVEVAGEARRLPGAIVSAVGNLSNLLFSAGVQAISGLIAGLTSMLGSLRSIAAEIGKTVAGAVKDSLSIRSPSRVFIDIGEDTLEGFMVGVRRKLPSLLDQMSNIGMDLPDAFVQPVDPNGGGAISVASAYYRPTVNVFIGNEQLDSRMASVAVLEINENARLAASGIRR